MRDTRNKFFTKQSEFDNSPHIFLPNKILKVSPEIEELHLLIDGEAPAKVPKVIGNEIFFCKTETDR